MGPDIEAEPGLNPEKSGTSTPGSPLVTGGVDGELELMSTTPGALVLMVGAELPPPADDTPCPSRPFAAPRAISGLPEPESLPAPQLESAMLTAMMQPELAIVLVPMSR
jgi:hypothetical protein